jgi:uncharacterized protein (TIGR02145 family)
MSLTDTPIGVAVTSSMSGQPYIDVGITATLELALVNNSGADIALNTGARPATFSVYPPVPKFFTVDQLSQMHVTTTGWSSTVDTTQDAINIACTRAGTWSDGETLTLTLANVTSSGPPGSDVMIIGPSNIAGNVPLSVQAAFAVAAAPQPGNLSLVDVLQVSVDSQGVVYRSDPLDPLTNTLFLTLKNTGATPLATDTDARAGNPQVILTFVYGNTSGALAPDQRNGSIPQGSAWNIRVAMGPAQTAWTASNPRPDGQEPHPQWVLNPSSTNLEILGPADSATANVTFAFSQIISFTPTGHTQMLVLCTGFARDKTTAYDDYLFVLDISKQDPPATRGLVSFFGTDPVIRVSDPGAKVKIPLRWAMFDVASVQLLTSSAPVAPLRKTYPNPQPLAYDEATVTLPPLRSSEAIFTTLQAFDGRGVYLNSLQFTAYAQVSYVTDAAGHVYTIALIGETFWMLENYVYGTPARSYFYQDDPANAQPFGRLYDMPAAQQHAPSGWSLPSVRDWNALIDFYGGADDAYARLLDGGRSGWGAQLGGWRTTNPDGSGSYTDMYSYGYYWGSEGPICTQFSSASASVSAGADVPTGAALSVRYIRHA